MSTTRPSQPARLTASPERAASRSARSWRSVEGAERWLIAAAAAGASRVRRKMAEAIDLSKLHGPEQVERALATCADAGRFADGDLAGDPRPPAATGGVVPLPLRASEESSLQRSTRSWEGFGR